MCFLLIYSVYWHKSVLLIFFQGPRTAALKAEGWLVMFATVGAFIPCISYIDVVSANEL